MSGQVPPPQGDEAELFRRHSSQLRWIVGREVRTSQADVEDACAFAWLQMLRYQPARETLLTWLCRTAIREALKLDRRARRSTLPADLTDGEPRLADPRSLLEDRLELLSASEAIAAAGLRKREAEVLSLQVAGYSYRETATALRITTRTVERQLLRARRKLGEARRRQIEDEPHIRVIASLRANVG